MNLTALTPNRKLPPPDEKKIQQLLEDTYRSPEFTSMTYSYPMNDARLMLEYTIKFFDNDNRTLYFRKAHKKNGEWKLDANPESISYTLGLDEPTTADREAMMYRLF